jgi:predicted SAM-dependent methyltransferase
MVNPLSAPYPKKLNLGSGWDIREGYLNVDSLDHGETNLLADVTDLPMLDSGYFDEIVAQDILEHIPRAKTVPTLREWNRLLSSDGVLFLRVPSLVHLLHRLSEVRDDPVRADEVVHRLYGTQAYPGDFHVAGFTAALLDQRLREAGLRIHQATLRDEWLFEVYAGKRATDGARIPSEAPPTARRLPRTPRNLFRFLRGKPIPF